MAQRYIHLHVIDDTVLYWPVANCSDYESHYQPRPRWMDSWWRFEGVGGRWLRYVPPSQLLCFLRCFPRNRSICLGFPRFPFVKPGPWWYLKVADSRPCACRKWNRSEFLQPRGIWSIQGTPRGICTVRLFVTNYSVIYFRLGGIDALTVQTYRKLVYMHHIIWKL